jgi:hypothetical protein
LNLRVYRLAGAVANARVRISNIKVACMKKKYPVSASPTAASVTESVIPCYEANGTK